MENYKIRNISIIIRGEEAYRNFYLSKAFSILHNNYNISYIIDKKLKKKKFFYKKYKNYFYNSNNNYIDRFKFGTHALILMLRNIKKSKTFKFRVERLLYPKNLNYNYIPYLKDLNFINKLKKIIFFTFKVFKNNLIYFVFKFFSSDLIYYLISKRYLEKKFINKNLNLYIKKTKPDLLIMPFNGLEIETPQSINFCAQNKIISYFITDNWDNLSSKSILIKKPNYIGVWSQQAKQHAIKIQNFRYKNIYILGCHRFDLLNSKLILKKKEKYILFLGHLFDWKEEELLITLNNILEKHKKKFKNIKILYRPHPKRPNRLKELINLPNIEIDEDTANMSNYLPSISNYSNKIKNSLFVISTCTSGALESVYVKKKVILLNYDDKNDFFNQKKLKESYLHFNNLEKIKLFIFCKKKSDIEHLLLKLLKSPKVKNYTDKEKKNIKFFINNDRKNKFKYKLLESVKNIEAKVY